MSERRRPSFINDHPDGLTQFCARRIPTPNSGFCWKSESVPRFPGAADRAGGEREREQSPGPAGVRRKRPSLRFNARKSAGETGRRGPPSASRVSKQPSSVGREGRGGARGMPSGMAPRPPRRTASRFATPPFNGPHPGPGYRRREPLAEPLTAGPRFPPSRPARHRR